MAVRLGRRLSQPQLKAKVNVVAETDGLHLSPLGSVVLGRRVAEVVQATLSKPCGRLEMGPMPQVFEGTRIPTRTYLCVRRQPHCWLPPARSSLNALRASFDRRVGSSD